MQDKNELLLAVLVAIGFGVFWGMPLKAQPTPVHQATMQKSGPRAATKLVVVAQGRAVTQNKR